MSVTHDNDTSTGTSTGTESPIISLSNHLNITNAKVSLLEQSESCDRIHVIAINMQKTNMLSMHKHKPYVPISSCVHVSPLSVYMLHMNPVQSTM